MSLQELSYPERAALGEKLRGARQGVAEAVTEEFFRRHPHWLTRFGERGRKLGIEDAGFHIDFLAGAVESGTPLPFQEYASWAARMLASRGIAPEFVAENLSQIGEAFGPLLSGEEHEIVCDFVRAGAAASTEQTSLHLTADTDTALAEVRRLFLQAILRGERKAASAIVLEALREDGSVLDLYIQVFQESQYEVGRLWESNRITVAQEHLATAITQFVLGQVYARLEPGEPKRGNLLITGVEGELHQVGANMVADVLEVEGWDVRFLGTHMPHSGILQAIEEHEASVVGISATMLFSVPRVRHLVQAVRERFGSGTRVVLGGSAFRFAPTLYQELGADGFAADLRSAVDLLCGTQQRALSHLT